MLELNKVNVYIEDMHILRDISLNVHKKEIVVMIGSNGAGKSTTVKTIVGLIKPSSGSVKFNGERIDILPPHRIVERGIAMVPEGRMLFSEMTVLENLELGVYIKRARARKKEALEHVFQVFPILRERKNQRAKTLSGGEAQMLAIAVCLMSSPSLLILDEPSLGLAPKIVLQTFNLIKEVNKEGVTVLLIEQNARHALELADRSYVLENGRIVLEGTADELMNNSYVKKAYLGI